MKKLTFIIAILFSALLGNAQTDIIYPAESGNIIFNCKINEVKNGNSVFYTKDSISYVVIAIAISKDGNYIDLKKYKQELQPNTKDNDTPHQALNKNYTYFESKYNKAKYNMISGVLLTVSGVTLTYVGHLMTNDKNDNNDKAGQISLVSGVVLVAVGIPVLIVNSYKKGKYKKEMEKYNQTNLSLGITNNGIGLVLNF
jgi:hypothetical protein